MMLYGEGYKIPNQSQAQGQGQEAPQPQPPAQPPNASNTAPKKSLFEEYCCIM